MKKLLLSLIATLLFSLNLNAQEISYIDLRLSGIVTEHFNEKPVKDAVVTAVDASGNKKIATTKSNGIYFVQLADNKNYIVSFSKDGKITKKVSIDTHEIADHTDVSLHEMDLQITLFDSIPNFDFSYFNDPIAQASYKKKLRTIGWKNDYTEIHQEVVDSIMNEYGKTAFGYYAHTRDKENNNFVNAEVSYIKETEGDAVVELTINDTTLAVATNVEYIPNLFYTVQVGVYSKEVPLTDLYGLSMLNIEKLDKGRVRYTSGRFSDEQSAENHKQVVVLMGVKDAFVVRYLNGKLFVKQKR